MKQGWVLIGTLCQSAPFCLKPATIHGDKWFLRKTKLAKDLRHNQEKASPRPNTSKKDVDNHGLFLASGFF